MLKIRLGGRLGVQESRMSEVSPTARIKASYTEGHKDEHGETLRKMTGIFDTDKYQELETLFTYC